MLNETKLNTGGNASHTVSHVCARAWFGKTMPISCSSAEETPLVLVKVGMIPFNLGASVVVHGYRATPGKANQGLI